VSNEQFPERFALTLDHVTRLEIAQRMDRANEIVDRDGRIDRDERESVD